MWIFCGGMQRSGSTLQFQITAQLVEEAGLGTRMEWVEFEQWPELRKKYTDFEGWKVFKNHTCTEEMMLEFHRQNAAGVYVYRDLRDVIVSTMKKYSTTFDLLQDMKFLQNCINQYYKWTGLPQVYVSRYEDIMENLPVEVENIANHLKIDLGQERYRSIASSLSIKKQKKRINEAIENGDLCQGYVKGSYFNPHTILHTNHINSGAVNGWKNILTKQQVALIEHQTGNWLVAHGYELSQTSFQRGWNIFLIKATRALEIFNFSLRTNLGRIRNKLTRRL